MSVRRPFFLTRRFRWARVREILPHSNKVTMNPDTAKSKKKARLVRQAVAAVPKSRQQIYDKHDARRGRQATGEEPHDGPPWKYDDVPPAEYELSPDVPVKEFVDALNYALTLHNKRAANSTREDALQKLIIAYVRRNPKATCRQVHAHLETLKGNGVIQDLDDETITWVRPNETLADTAVTALKDRVSRAKK
jgi:hypothetical protein